jgi:hypothetical protein
VNFLQRFFAWWRAMLASAQGVDTGVVSPLPPPLVNPRTPVAALVARAEANGEADARAAKQDSWSFGGPDDPVSDAFDPSFVRSLREECEAAVQTIQNRQDITASRTAHLLRWREDARGFMAAARTMMTGLAVREARMVDLAMRRDMAASQVPVDPADVPTVAPDDRIWEGETNPLSGFWRMLILVGLIVAELPVQYFVYDYFLSERAGSAGVVLLLSMSTSLLMVFGPHIAGLLLRARQSTGADRRITPAAIALAAPWLFVVIVLGVLRGAILDADETRVRALHLTPTTVVGMFVALLLVVGVMAFMLGLAKRHPYQEAHARQRRRSERFDTVRQSMVERMNPAYVEQDDPGADPVDAEIRTVRAAYAAAEEAYFAALTRAVGDPTFTEAVQQRRGVRQVSPPDPTPPDQAEQPGATPLVEPDLEPTGATP